MQNETDYFDRHESSFEEYSTNDTMDFRKVAQSKNISIVWRNLCYEANSRFVLSTKEKKPILLRLNGSFEFHALNGLMGPSGAGKTTLLNCLSGQNRNGMILSEDSEIYLPTQVDHHHHHQNRPRIRTYFIEQNVHQSVEGCLTVGELFSYAYRFKNRRDQTSKMGEHISRMLKELMLNREILNRKFENCSGGEQKRVAIGQELMSRSLASSILFVDEPTTGLDSASAVVLINCLKQLTKSYRMSVIASIHVPSDEILAVFDKLYVLAKGGVCVYSGIPSEIKNILIKKLNFDLESRSLPIEVLMKIACNGIQDTSVVKLAQYFLSKEFTSVNNFITETKNILLPPSKNSRTFSFDHFFLQFSRQFRVNFIAKYKTQLLYIALYLGFFLLLTTMFGSDMTTASGCMRMRNDDNQTTSSSCTAILEDEIRFKENLMFLSYVMMYVGVVVICSSSVAFSAGMAMFRCEHRNHWYSLGVFYWSTTLIGVLELLFYGIFTSTVAYFISSQNAADNYQINWHRLLLYIFFMCLTYLYWQTTGQLIGVLMVDHQEYALMFSLFYCTLALMINGTFVDTEHTENLFIIYGSSAVGLKFVTFGVMYSIFGFERCHFEKEFSFVLQLYGIRESQVWNYVLYSGIYVLVVRSVALGLICLRFWVIQKGSSKNSVSKKTKFQQIEFENIKDFREPKMLLNSSNGLPTKAQNSIILRWTNLSLYSSSSIYETESVTQDRERILRNLSGQLHFGTLNALMGTSGAGKTTLLKVLNGQLKTQLSSSTQFYLSVYYKIETCFITQEVSNHLRDGLTVRQSLLYASRLKNPELSRALQHFEIVQGLLEELGLLSIENTKAENCSGGERKRLALALELTSSIMPNLICIDEPTSGLDSNSAEIVISCLKKLTRTHSLTIVTSIHQPNCEILDMFDQLYILARGGVCIYSGILERIPDHLRRIDCATITDANSKLAIEALIKHSCAGHHDATVRALVENQKKEFEIQGLFQSNGDIQPAPDGVLCNRTRFTHKSVCILTLRYLSYIRGALWKEQLFYLINYLFYAYILIWFYDPKMFQVTGCIDLTTTDTSCARGVDTIGDTNLLLNNTKYNYFLVTFYLFFVLVQTSLVFRRELVHFENEHRNGWYSTGAFYLMKSTMEILPLIPMNLIYVYLSDYYEDIRPGFYWPLVFFLTLNAIGFQAIAHICAILCVTSLNALIITVVTLFLFTTMVGNFFILYSRLHYFYQFLSQFCISKFVYEALTLLQYGFGRCGPKEIQPVLYVMKLVDDDLYYCLWMCAFNLVLFRVAAFWLLVRHVAQNDNRNERAAKIVDYALRLEEKADLNNAGLGSSSQEFHIKL